MRISDWSSDVCSSDLPAILPLFAQPLIDADLLPAIENARFLGGEARLHRKVGLRQEDGVAPVARGGVGCVGHGVAALKARRASAQSASICRTSASRSSNFASGRRNSISSTSIVRSEEHTSELQSLMRLSSAGFCLKTK